LYYSLLVHVPEVIFPIALLDQLMSSGEPSEGNAVEREASHTCLAAERKLYLPHREFPAKAPLAQLQLNPGQRRDSISATPGGVDDLPD
jgi:hypothetical protein